MSKKEKYEVIVRVLELRNAGAELQPLHIQFIRNKHVASSRPNKSRRAIRETNIFTAVWHDSDDMAFDLNLQHGSSRMTLLKSFSSDDSHEPNSVTFGDGSHDKKKIRVHVLNAANQCLGHGHFFVTGAVNQRVALRLKKKGSAKATTLSAFFTLFFELNINPSNNSKQTQGDAFHGHVDPSSFLAVLDRDSNAVEIVSSSSSCVVSSCVMPNARGSNSSTPSAVLTDTSSETLPLPTSARELGVHQRRRTDSMYGVLLSSMTCANDTRLNNDAKNDLPLMVEMNENGSVAESSVLTNEFQIIPSVDKIISNRFVNKNANSRSLRSIDEVEESVEMCHSIGEDTIDSIRQAKETLHRHAKRHGLKIQITGSVNTANDGNRVVESDDAPEVASFIHMLCCNPSQEPSGRNKSIAPLFQRTSVCEHNFDPGEAVENYYFEPDLSHSKASSASDSQSFHVDDDFTVGSSTINDALR